MPVVRQLCNRIGVSSVVRQSGLSHGPQTTHSRAEEGAEVADATWAITLNTIRSNEREDHRCYMTATATRSHSNLYVAGGWAMTSARIINSIRSKVALRPGSRIQSNFDTTPRFFDTT